MCEKCGRLHLISSAPKLRRIAYDKQRGEFKLTCLCQGIGHFSKRVTKPYSVPNHALDLGYAELGEYHEEKESNLQ